MLRKWLKFGIYAKVSPEKINIRPSNLNDAYTIWNIINDPSVRQVTFQQKVIQWEEHERWYHDSLSDPKRLIYIIEDVGNNIIGMLRFDIRDNHSEVSIVLNQKRRGQGHGPNALKIGCNEVYNLTGISSFYAYVKSNNYLSLKAFKKAGFVLKNTTQIDNIDAEILVYKIKK